METSSPIAVLVYQSSQKCHSPRRTKNDHLFAMKFVEPYETLHPCRSRTLVGAVLLALLVGLVLLLAG